MLLCRYSAGNTLPCYSGLDTFTARCCPRYNRTRIAIELNTAVPSDPKYSVHISSIHETLAGCVPCCRPRADRRVASVWRTLQATADPIRVEKTRSWHQIPSSSSASRRKMREMGRHLLTLVPLPDSRYASYSSRSSIALAAGVLCPQLE